jgi:hypothetical protein
MTIDKAQSSNQCQSTKSKKVDIASFELDLKFGF